MVWKGGLGGLGGVGSIKFGEIYIKRVSYIGGPQEICALSHIIAIWMKSYQRE